MNLTIFSLNFYNSYNYSPFLIKKSNFNSILNSKFINFFNSISILTLLKFKKNIFKNFLNTIYILNENLYKNLNISTFQTFSYDLITEFNECIFSYCSSNKESSGISFSNSNYILKINKCGFYFMTNSFTPPSASSIFVLNAKYVLLTYLCFTNCLSNHGTSYGIHSNTGTILNCSMLYSLEFNVGYNNRIPNHPSYIGSDNNLIFKFNNISDSFSQGQHGCGFYFLNLLYHEISYSQTFKMKGYSFSIYYLGNNYELNNMNFINNSCTNSWFNSLTTNYIILKNSLFINNSINPYFSGSGFITFNNCKFSNNELTGATFQTCYFNYNNFDKIDLYFNSIQCWNLGQIISLKPRFRSFNFFYIFFIILK